LWALVELVAQKITRAAQHPHSQLFQQLVVEQAEVMEMQ
jgi:hypothetical protein